MSEYQYYEFQAIDRPLTAGEMSALREYSTRARITPTSFVNEYSWGSFKGSQDLWMEKYFDAFLYLANWGSHVLKLSLPSRLLDRATAQQYCDGESTSLREKADKLILTFASEDENGGDWVEGTGHLASMISIRSELARGDLRALYLGWLAGAQDRELEDEEVEPPVPPGLGQLNAGLESLADFLRIDRDILHAAAVTSPPLADQTMALNDVKDWVRTLPTNAKDDLLAQVIVDTDRSLVAELQQQFVRTRSAGVTAPKNTHRTVGQLLRAAEVYSAERLRIEAEKLAKDQAREQRKTALLRKQFLDSLVGSERTLWAEVNTLIATKLPKSYDRAVNILLDLRDLEARDGAGKFQARLEKVLQDHAQKRTLVARLKKAFHSPSP